MNKPLLLALLIALPISHYSQNYQPVNSEIIAFYKKWNGSFPK